MHHQECPSTEKQFLSKQYTRKKNATKLCDIFALAYLKKPCLDSGIENGLEWLEK